MGGPRLLACLRMWVTVEQETGDLATRSHLHSMQQPTQFVIEEDRGTRWNRRGWLLSVLGWDGCLPLIVAISPAVLLFVIPERDLGELTVSIPFNDEAALASALATHDIACVLAEPVMTNCGMILPDPGFHDVLRRLTSAAGTLLLIDETHTISTGPGGYSRMHGLDPDLMVMGKPIGGGIPVSVWGMSEAVAERLHVVRREQSGHGHSGIGTTLSGSALQLACLRACLEHVMTEEAYAKMQANADRIEAGFKAAITGAGLDWTVSRVGARLEVVFSALPVKNAAEARAAASDTIEAALHLSMLNLGYLLTPFHNMVLVSPALSEEQAGGLVNAFSTVLERLIERRAAA